MLNKKNLLPIISTLVVLLIALGLYLGYKGYINSRIQKGEKHITVEVIVDTDSDKYTKTYKFWTEEVFLGKVLDDKVNITTNSFPGMGRFINSVDGYSQDPDKGLYWIIYINDKSGEVGMDDQPIAHNDVIRIELKPYVME